MHQIFHYEAVKNRHLQTANPEFITNFFELL